MRIAICDDNQLAANYMEEYLSGLPLKDISYEVFSSGGELISYMETNAWEGTFNIYFMDIEMPGLNGIETAMRIRGSDNQALIIFITEHKEYVYDVFEALPFRFIIKPVTKDKLDKALREALENIRLMKRMFFFKVERTTVQVPFDKILYFESGGRKITLVSADGCHEFYGKLSSVKKDLDGKLFLQIHTSYLVNMEFIRHISETEVVMDSGVKLPVSKKYRKETKTRHLSFMEWKCGR